eukprot:gnl/Spiro4/9711_TR5163_c0_g1_i2.p1 gnl/Spiro4/9711_TR5163_c0_g1~~gnl/Spiro4/9711_TR5163_c0_g1_i2.p1  ORF type:complete len:539 (+),score=85.11 gnl/Spiro4/9711_TR5163_c0_g1_i2:46-1617(+)
MLRLGALARPRTLFAPFAAALLHSSRGTGQSQAIAPTGTCPFSGARSQPTEGSAATVSATTEEPSDSVMTVPTIPIPTVGKLRTYFDLWTGGYLKDKAKGIPAYINVLMKRLNTNILNLPGLSIVVIADPDDWMAVLRSEWSWPTGGAASTWVFKAFYKDYNTKPFAVLTGEEWAAKRHKIQPQIFLQSAIAHYVPTELATVAKDAMRFIDSTPNKTPVLSDLTSRVAFEMVANVLIGLRVGLLTDSASPLTKEFVKCAMTGLAACGPLTSEYDEAKGLKMPEWQIYKENWGRALKLGEEMVKESEQAGVDCVFKRLKDKGKLSAEYLSVELCTLLAAGVDTTACTMQQTLYAIAKYPHVQKALKEEVDRVLGKDGEITAAKLSQMHYLRAFSREQHRLHFVLCQNGRLEPHEVVLRNGQFRIPAGQMAVFDVSPYHSDPELLFGDPSLFLPERWLNRKGMYDRVKGGGKAAERGFDTEANDDSPHPPPGERLGVVPNYVDLAAPAEPRTVDVFAPSLKSNTR